ncbi:MAG: glycosyltransferase family 4 protein [Salibacteraceae bacterium]
MQLLEAFHDKGFIVEVGSASAKSEHAAKLAHIVTAEHHFQMNDSSFDVSVKEIAPTVVLFDRFMVEEQFGWRVEKACPSALRILDTEDLHFLRKARQVKVLDQSPLNLHSESAIREVAAIYRCDLSLIISEVEMKLLQNDFKMDPQILCYLPFLDSGMKHNVPLAFTERNHFVSIGNFMHPPNRDAVKILASEIWPMIRTRLPEAELHVYGAYPEQIDRELHNPQQGIFMEGRADDASFVLNQAKVLLAPLRFGAGLKGKLFQCMQSSTPFVTTTIGLEGFQHDATPSDGWADFIDRAIEIYTQEKTWYEVVDHGKKALQHFKPEDHIPTLFEALNNIQNNIETHRSKNFIGAMLRHHFMRSTEFMSRWIEEKSKR